jgi:hypothetical protein
MTEQHQIAPATDPVHLSFSEQRQPTIRGSCRRYALARGDQLAFAAEVVRFGFAPDDFALDIEWVRGNRSVSSPAAPSFTVTVENLRNGRTATFVGGPGRSWVAAFLSALITGEFGQV